MKELLNDIKILEKEDELSNEFYLSAEEFIEELKNEHGRCFYMKVNKKDLLITSTVLQIKFTIEFEYFKIEKEKGRENKEIILEKFKKEIHNLIV